MENKLQKKYISHKTVIDQLTQTLRWLEWGALS